jgi:predicted Rossmann-fold nucleotide-binding protein
VAIVADHMQLARETAQCLGEAGFAIMSGAGAGMLEAANHGARIAVPTASLRRLQDSDVARRGRLAAQELAR